MDEKIRCANCKRMALPIEMMELHGWPEFIDGMVCGFCRVDAIRNGKLTRSEMAQRFGMAAEVIAEIQASERAMRSKLGKV